MKPVLVNGVGIGPGERCYVIAEAGVNHNGDGDLARQLIDAAAEAGADAVKFQTFSSERLSAPSAPQAAYQKTAAPAASQLEMLKKLELSREAHEQLIQYARQRSIEFLSTPFDTQSASLLDALGVAAFKIGSGDLTDRLLLRHVAGYKRPMLLSTGGATLDEVHAALRVIRDAGDPPVVLLHCVSMYPTAVEDVNLLAIDALQRACGVPVGFSDHTLDLLAPVLAVARGACVIEKHLTLSRTLEGPDHRMSLEPEAFAQMVRDIRRTERALGSGRKEPHPGERSIIHVVRKSLFAARRIPDGAVIAETDLAALRPGSGISAMDADRVVGRAASRQIEAGEMISLDMLVEGPARP